MLSIRRRSALFGVLASATLIVGSVSSSGTATAADVSFSPPKAYLMALGDSLPFGLQVGKLFDELDAGTYDPSNFPGFVVPLQQRIASFDPGIQVVNFSCPASDSSEFISDACGFFAPLHNPYDGTQLAAATSFLKAHRGQVAPIVIRIGAGDLFNVFFGCKFKDSCIAPQFPGTLSTLHANLVTIFSTLMAAAPDTEVVTLDLYDPFAIKYPNTVTYVQQVNAAYADAAAQTKVRFADLFTPFNGGNNQPATLCALTLYCQKDADTHPSDAGYAAIASLVFDATGYAKF